MSRLYFIHTANHFIKMGSCCSFIDPTSADFFRCQMLYEEFVRFPTGIICVFLWLCLHCALTCESNSTSNIQQGKPLLSFLIILFFSHSIIVNSSNKQPNVTRLVVTYLISNAIAWLDSTARKWCVIENWAHWAI